MKSLKGAQKRNNIILYIVLSALAFVWVIPIIWIILTSFRAEGGAFVNYFFPKQYTLNNSVHFPPTFLRFRRNKWVCEGLILVT